MALTARPTGESRAAKPEASIGSIRMIPEMAMERGPIAAAIPPMTTMIFIASGLMRCMV